MSRVMIIAMTVWRETLRRKDVYVIVVMLTALLYALLSVNVFGLGHISRYVLDLGLMLTWLFALILAVSISCRQLPDEERRGTIYPLLAKPVTRGELLIGKWAGAWTIVSSATAALYILVIGMTCAYGGPFDGITLFQGWAVHIAGLGSLSALGIALSTRMTFGAAASLCFAVMAYSVTLLPRIPEFLVGAQGLRENTLLIVYYLLPHFELFDMRIRIVHQWGPLRASSFAILLIYSMVLTAIFLFVAWLGYRRKYFERGAAL